VQDQRSHSCPSGKSLLATLLIGLVLLLDAMAASPALHELIHKDADRPGHECAVTMFAHGKVDSLSCELPVVAPTGWVETIPFARCYIASTVVENLPHGRAPPLLCVAS